MEIITDSLDGIFNWLQAVNWFDVTMVLLLTTSIALFAQKRLTGFLIGVGALLMLRPLLLLGERDPLLAIAFGLLVGAALGFVAQVLSPRLRWSNRNETILGGLGGLAFGIAFILAMVISLPINVNRLHNPPTVHYPDLEKLPTSTYIHDNINNSQVMEVGYDILLYNLFGDEPLNFMHSSIDPDLVRALNQWLVVGTPWEGNPLEEIDDNDANGI